MAKAKSEPVRRIYNRNGKQVEVTVIDIVESGSRPYKKLTEDGADFIAGLFGMGYTIDEVCSELGISENTLRNKRNEDLLNSAIKKGESQKHTSIKRALYSIMKGGKGNATMAIFMAKAVLHMSDQPRAEPPDVPFDAGIEAQLERLTGDEQ